MTNQDEAKRISWSKAIFKTRISARKFALIFVSFFFVISGLLTFMARCVFFVIPEVIRTPARLRGPALVLCFMPLLNVYRS